MENASLTISLAMVAGVLAQTIAGHLRVPGIIVLLAVGVLLGPDVANLVRPASMGGGLQSFVGFAVAIILFEGGLQMNLGRLRKQQVPIRRLVTVGALVTAVGGALAAKLAMGWNWSLSILFGTLVIVTGPTVITPLLRRFAIKHNTATILEAEGIFIDAVGATIAVVALEVSLVGTSASAAVGVLDVLWRIGVGAFVGGASGAFLAVLIRWRKVVPHGLENILSLSVALASFQIANALVHEAGITAAIAAGMVISNTRSHAFEEIVEFKEQLTSFSIATLFVLLTANVRIESVINIAGPGLLVVALLMFVVRPIGVILSTWGTDVTWKQKVFLSWLAPRGIVAAAVASLFAAELDGKVDGGGDMLALVFLVIACTVTLQGLTGGFLARILGLAHRRNHGYLILGANALARRMAAALSGPEDPVVLIDSNETHCALAKQEGLSVIYGNGLEPRTLLRGRVSTRRASLALTPNETINFLFAQRVKQQSKESKVHVALESEDDGITAAMAHELPARILFGGERPLGLWVQLLTQGVLKEERWEMGFPKGPTNFSDAPSNAFLPIALCRGRERLLVEEKQTLQKKDVLVVLIRPEQQKTAHTWLRDAGFLPADPAKAVA